MPLQAPDNHATPGAKNDELANLLKLDWNHNDIRTIKRSDTPEFKGWTAFLAGEQPSDVGDTTPPSPTS